MDGKKKDGLFTGSARNMTNSPRKTDFPTIKLMEINSSHVTSSPRAKQWNTFVDPYTKKEASHLVAFQRGLSKNELSERELPSKLSPKQLQSQRDRYKQLLSQVVNFDKNSKQDYQLESPYLSNMSQTNFPEKISSHSPTKFFTDSSRRNTFENLKLPMTKSQVNSFTQDAVGMMKINRTLSESQIIPDDSKIIIETVLSDQKQKGIVHRNNYIKADSKFNEIIELQKRVSELEKQNEALRLELKTIDEFKLAMTRKTKLEDFNEKRIDLLKAQLSRQKRYIDLIHKSLKQAKSFHKDLISVLDYLIELDKKYMRGNTLSEELEKLETDSSNNVQVPGKLSTEQIYKTLYDVFREKNTTEEFEKFVQNFNEAYDKIKHVHQKNEEVSSIYSITMQLLKAEDMFENRINPENQKKIKYSYLLKKFVEKHRRIFPSFITWNDYSMKDKESFTSFLRRLEKISYKIKDVFHKVSAFDLLKHNTFNCNDEVPEILVENAVGFGQYFNSSNKGKRLWLNSKEISELEKSLSSLLSQLIRFQRNLFFDKGKITVEHVFELEELLRTNVEKLLCLGISTDVDSGRGGKIVVVNKLYNHGYRPAKIVYDEKLSPLKERIEKFYLEVYSWEEENLKKFEYAKSGADLYFQKLSKFFSELSGVSDRSAQLEDIEKYKLHIEHICERYKEIHMVGKLKDLQIRYYKEYTTLLTSDSLDLESFVKTKSSGIDAFFKKILDGLRELEQAYDQFFGSTESNNPKNKKNFCATFQRFADETTELVNKVFGNSSFPLYSDVKNFDVSFRPQFERLQSTLNYFSERLSNISLKVC